MDIKIAEKNDFERLEPVLVEVELHHVALEPSVFRPISNYSRDYFDELVDADYEVIFYTEIDGKVAGVLIAAEQEYPPLPVYVGGKYTSIRELSVASEFRRRGVGKALMERAEHWAALRGHSQVQLNVWEKNRGAVKFYEELGYLPKMIHYKKELL